MPQSRFEDAPGEPVDLDPRNGEGARHFPMLMGIEGPLRGKSFPLNRQVTTLGRDMQADIVLKDEKVSRNHARVIYLNIGERNETPICRVFDAGSSNGTFINQRRVDSGGEALTDKDRLQVGRTVFAFFLTDDQSVSAKERLERLATEDDATGLMTEALFIKQLRREFERAKRYERRLSLLAVALEGLDFIRERHGAAARNAAMKRVGFALTQALRTHDILARSEEGDDILVLLPETNAENALLVAERLARGLAGEKIAHGDQILTVRPVIGATSMDWDLSSADELLKHARQALSQARGRGDRQILAWTENPMKP